MHPYADEAVGVASTEHYQCHLSLNALASGHLNLGPCRTSWNTGEFSGQGQGTVHLARPKAEQGSSVGGEEATVKTWLGKDWSSPTRWP